MSGKRQRRAAAALALAGVLGIVRAADALLLCEDTTGFAAGGPWPRMAAYALLCVPALTLRPQGALRLPARRRGVRAARPGRRPCRFLRRLCGGTSACPRAIT